MIEQAVKEIERMMEQARLEEKDARCRKNAADMNYHAGAYCGLASAKRIFCEAMKAEAESSE
jgi:hypothetical protein